MEEEVVVVAAAVAAVVFFGLVEVRVCRFHTEQMYRPELHTRSPGTRITDHSGPPNMGTGDKT